MSYDLQLNQKMNAKSCNQQSSEENESSAALIRSKYGEIQDPEGR